MITLVEPGCQSYRARPTISSLATSAKLRARLFPFLSLPSFCTLFTSLPPRHRTSTPLTSVVHLSRPLVCPPHRLSFACFSLGSLQPSDGFCHPQSLRYRAGPPRRGLHPSTVDPSIQGQGVLVVRLSGVVSPLALRRSSTPLLLMPPNSLSLSNLIVSIIYLTLYVRKSRTDGKGLYMVRLVQRPQGET